MAKKRGKEMDAFPSFEWRDDLTLIAQTERGERESDQWRERERLEDMEDKKKMLCKKEAEESREEVKREGGETQTEADRGGRETSNYGDYQTKTDRPPPHIHTSMKHIFAAGTYTCTCSYTYKYAIDQHIRLECYFIRLLPIAGFLNCRVNN